MKNKVWFITGVSSGLGAALAQHVMENGDFVIGTLRKKSQVQEFNERHQGKGHAYLLDISKTEDISPVIEKVIATYQKIDLLVNNAGVGFIGAIEESSLEEVRKVFETNFFGTLKLTQAVLPYMRKAKKGHIVQISSHGGIKAFAGFGIYNASKFALEGFSEALAQEVAPLGIKVIIIEPGPFRTQFASPSLGEAAMTIDDYQDTAGAFRSKLKEVHGKQEGDPAKAAQAILEAVNTSDASLRLPLGKVALKTIGMKLDSVSADLQANKHVAEQSVFTN